MTTWPDVVAFGILMVTLIVLTAIAAWAATR